MTSFTLSLFILAAVLYVDDADLVHMTALVTVTPKELIEHLQLSMDAW
jgi:hypothetical protein